tara:strand:- start:266 stop:817 length:552 start_codon:yes stop_codon:yes gene_type:complete
MKTLLILPLLLAFASCDMQGEISKQTNLVKPKITKNADGSTLEQDNIRAYRTDFSDPKSLKHLYVFNDQGDCIFYDSVRGKVTSGNKRLRPKTVAATDGQYVGRQHYGIPITIDGESRRTAEVPSYDGTYGSSEAYIYWRTTSGQFRKLSLGAGMSTIVTTAPIRGIKARIEIVTEVEPAEDQ